MTDQKNNDEANRDSMTDRTPIQRYYFETTNEFEVFLSTLQISHGPIQDSTIMREEVTVTFANGVTVECIVNELNTNLT